MNMKKKLCLLLSCLACIGMFTWRPLPSEAAACPHDLCYTDGFSNPTGVVFSYDENTHTIEYGIENICSFCGYRYFRDTHPETEAHQFLHLTQIADTDTHYIYLGECEYCPEFQFFYRWK